MRYIIVKQGLHGNLFWTGAQWSPEYPDARLYRTERLALGMEVEDGVVVSTEDYYL